MSARLSDEAFRAIVAPILASGGSWRDVAEATGLLFDTARIRAIRLGLRSQAKGGRISETSPKAEWSRRMVAPDWWPGWNAATPEQRIQAIRDGLEQNFGARRMSAALGVTRQTLQKWVHRVPQWTGQTNEEIAAAAEARRAQALRDVQAARAAAHRERLRPLAERMRAMVAAGQSVRSAGAALDISEDRAKYLAKVFDIRVSKETQAALRRAAAAKGRAAVASKPREIREPKPKPVAKPQDHAARLARNPKLSPAQQAVADAIKEATWRRVDYRLMALPRPTEEEAARLVAEHIARRGITRCPPPVEMKAPVNYGEGWGARR